MKIVFADTFYFLALLNKKDRSHSKATAYAASLTNKLLTTEWVMTELADGLSASHRRQSFLRTRAELLEDDDATIVPFEMPLYESGLQLYENRPDKDWSLTDCVSFGVMQ